MDWYVYIVKCRDGSLYTGISPDVVKRVLTHNSGKGAKAIKGKLPVSLVYKEKIGSKITAAKREREIKSFTRIKKLELINSAPYENRKRSNDLTQKKGTEFCGPD